MTATYWIGATATPNERVASGFSPVERRRSPNRVRYNTYDTGKTSRNATITLGDMFWKAFPRPHGSFESKGMSIGWRCGSPGLDCVAFPNQSWDRNRATPTAARLITTP